MSPQIKHTIFGARFLDMRKKAMRFNSLCLIATIVSDLIKTSEIGINHVVVSSLTPSLGDVLSFYRDASRDFIPFGLSQFQRKLLASSPLNAELETPIT